MSPLTAGEIEKAGALSALPSAAARTWEVWQVRLKRAGALPPHGGPAKKAAAAKKELTPQQQKMKDCAGKWGDYKKEKKVKGRAEYRKFMSGCLKA